MSLTGQQFDRIQKTIASAYNRDTLRRAVKACMNEDFDRLVADKAFSTQVSELVQWAERTDRALELVRCAHEQNPSNKWLAALWEEAHGWMLDTPIPQAPMPPPDAPHHVFLAYSSKDADLMRRLRSDLLAAGIVAWIADENLELGGAQWQHAIEAALRAATCVVVIMSPDAKESEWVNIEISRARRIGRRIFPLLARGDDDEVVPLILETTNYVDVRTDYNGGVQGKLIPALRKYLGMTDAVTLPLPRNTAPVKPLTKEDKQPADASAEVVKPKKTVKDSPIPASTNTKPSRKEPAIVVPKPTVLRPTSPINFEWITIPAGEFLMGSDKMAQEDELPQHTVNLGEYRIAKYPVTNAQYLEFARATKHGAPEPWKSGTIPTGKENHPVVNVTWQDAQAFCKWANVRLPSEAEWEMAARGTDGRIWPWGDDQPTKEHCNFASNEGDTTPVGKYPKGAGPFGVMDMAGNVWEWTGSLYKPYPYRPGDGREDPNGDGARTLRGGSWYSNGGGYVRCAVRYWSFPNRFRGYRVGFRVVSPGF